jgi:hypothetical protein
MFAFNRIHSERIKILIVPFQILAIAALISHQRLLSGSRRKLFSNVVRSFISVGMYFHYK